MAGGCTLNVFKLELTNGVQGYNGKIPVSVIQKLFRRSPTWFSVATIRSKGMDTVSRNLAPVPRTII